MRIDPVKTRCSQRVRWTNPGVRSLKKVVQVEYPDCVKIDTMNRAEYHRRQATDWPDGTWEWFEGCE